jgi:sulfur dioxygenase
MGERSKADVVAMRVGDGDRLPIEGMALDVIYTPRHTDDSCSLVMPDRVFTGDTLFICGISPIFRTATRASSTNSAGC